MMEKTVFQKILDREIPAEIEYEDEHCFVIRDINPQAPEHLLIIPRKPVIRLSEAEDGEQALLGRLLLAARDVAAKLDFKEGFRVVINNGPRGGESVPHLHAHLLAGRQMAWPPG